jgi:ribosomal protein L40E
MATAPYIPEARERDQQHHLWCRVCGEGNLLARGLCRRCYARNYFDRRLFGGRRERVRERDGGFCQACGQPGRGTRALPVHHRRPGISQDRYLITVCRRCHARIHRTRMLLKILPALLVELWREQHPDGVEQLALDFDGGESPEQLPLV